MKWRRDFLLVFCGILVWFLADAQRIRQAAGEALALCGRTAVPALFPFLVVSGLLVALGIGDLAAPLLSGFMGPLFGLPGQAASPLLLGFVGGYPIGAGTAADLYRRRQLTKEETERLLAFCNNSNPVFLVSVLGTGIFHSTRAGIWLWVIHVASALLTGLLFRRRRTAHRRGPVPQLSRPQETSLAAAFLTAVRTAAWNMVAVCGFVVFFSTLAAPLGGLPAPWDCLLAGLLELFSMTPLLSSARADFLLASFCTGFGGLSVLCQTAAVLEDTDLSIGPYVRGKLCQGIISAVLAAFAGGWLGL